VESESERRVESEKAGGEREGGIFSFFSSLNPGSAALVKGGGSAAGLIGERKRND
jgi:hypothetical protein